MKNKNADILITSKETAQMLKISIPTLRKLRHSGIIPSYRIGNKILYKKQEVMETVTNEFACRKKSGERDD
jgi:excisionase family DNA binding protein